MNNKRSRTELSVGITQDFAHCQDRAKFMFWLEVQAPVCEFAALAKRHIEEIEGLFAVQKHAVLSKLADEMRNKLAEIRPDKTDEWNRGAQFNINFVIDTIEELDLETQSATSIAELQAAMVLEAATLIKNPKDYEAVVNFGKALKDGHY